MEHPEKKPVAHSRLVKALNHAKRLVNILLSPEFPSTLENVLVKVFVAILRILLVLGTGYLLIKLLILAVQLAF